MGWIILDYAIGIDLGGTFIKGALVDQNGSIVMKKTIPTHAVKGAQHVMEQMSSLVLELMRHPEVAFSKIAGIGMGIPGVIDYATGTAIQVVNLGWNNIALKEPLEKRIGLPILMDNDANVAALGEMWAGAGKGCRNLICVTLGTGVGGGIVVDGKLLHGAHVLAGEIGHIVMDPRGSLCSCGNRGCLETVASATGVVRLVQEALDGGELSTLAGKELSSEAISLAAASGDALALNVVHRAMDTLGRALAIAANIIDPDVIVVGGGMAHAGDTILFPLRISFEKYSLRRISNATRVVLARLGNDAGVVGAAWMALEERGISI